MVLLSEMDDCPPDLREAPELPQQTLMSEKSDLPQQTPALLSWIFGQLVENQDDYIPIICKVKSFCILLSNAT